MENPSREFRSALLGGIPLWGPLRATFRLLVAFVWILSCYIVLRVLSIALIPFPESRYRARHHMNKVWVRGMRYIIGMRIKMFGEMPPHPYFIVCNHIAWGDYFLMSNVQDQCTYVLQAEDEHLPIAGALMSANDPIFNVRTRKGVPVTVAKMVDLFQRQKLSLTLTPEGVVGPGKIVRRFHAALLEAAVQAQKPVHYCSITCRTPEGCPPASKTVLFGPDPYFLGPDGKIPQSEIDAWGPERSFFTHLLGVLCLPWHEFIVRVAPEPISGTDRVILANQLHDAVQDIFVPVE